MEQIIPRSDALVSGQRRIDRLNVKDLPLGKCPEEDLAPRRRDLALTGKAQRSL